MTNIFLTFCKDVFVSEKLDIEDYGSAELKEILCANSNFQLESFLGSDYTDSSTLPVYLSLLLNESLGKINPVTSTPFQYLKAIINWRPFLYFLEEYHQNLR